ncbi:MAG: OmpA family protein [Alphaproteobacteria bacterium]|nr:OmpA family protein [Alphaproteobacteria bacterium]
MLSSALRLLTARSLGRALPGLALAAALGLGGCVTQSAVEDLAQAQANGSAFNQALFRNYSFLARSFGRQDTLSSGSAFDSDGSLDLGDSDSDMSQLADLYALKALSAAADDTVLPETPPDNDADAQAMHLKLLQALDQGRDKAPEEAARAQVDYDCWLLNRHVPGMQRASQACRNSLNGSLAKLQRALGPQPVATPAPAPTAPSGDYTVFFDFDSWTLTAEAMSTLQQAIDAARSGRQSRINIVGHTDTAGASDYNQALSLRRANVVKDVLVQLGARPEAITTSGVGEADLAVQTADGVREPKNRRSVVTLVP